MVANLIPLLTLCAALGCGVMAGLFFTFSAFLMRALGRLPTAQGITAMQTINVAVLNPAFGLVFFGTTLACLCLAVASLTAPQPFAFWRLLGAFLFLAGVIAVTTLVHVPLNDALAEVDPESLEGAKFWQRYLTVWTAWNHVRTLAALGGTVSFILAFRG